MSRWPPERLEREAYPGPGMDLPVFYNDLDTNGHLNNVALGRFFEHSRIGVFGPGFHESLDGGHFLVARVAIDYLNEGLLGDLHLRTRITRVGNGSVTVEQAAWQRGLVVGLAESVLAHLKDGRATPMPEQTRALLASRQ